MQNNRITYLDAAKGVAILLMMLDHIWGFNNPVSEWIYSFHMPIFFIISGILIKYTNAEQRNLSKIIISKLKGLLIPYLVFEFGFVIIFGTLHKFDYNVLKWHAYDGLLLNPANGPLWFLICIFISEIVFISIKKYIKNPKIQYLIVSVIYVVPFFVHINNLYVTILLRCCSTIGFIGIGYISCLLVFKKDYSIFVILTVAVVNVILSAINGKVNLYTLNYSNPILYTICALLGLYSVIFLLKKMNSKVLEFLGQNTLFLLGTHMIMRGVITRVLHIEASTYLGGIVILIIMCLILTPVIVFVNKYMPFVVGKKRVESIK
ncbi:acyltransferase family protein [Intestinibacter bartlettii]|uniref:acyltransferase family protein n=1 Tax=Intestinibacter bartlettii TaxID=261299 RepID=UPI00321C24BE